MESSRLTKIASAVLALAAASALVACGTQQIDVGANKPGMEHAAVLFQQRCSGCHSLAAAASNGSASNVRQALKTNGPNFNQRKESYERAIYAIQNGGFSGAIMPANIVTGADAKLVAQFVAKYSGTDVNTPPSPSPMPMPKQPAPAATTTTAAGGTAALVAEGRSLFAQNGCGGCHVLKDAGAVGKVGPSLQGIGGDPAAMITKSIVNPNAQVEKPYQPNIMPQTFGKTMTPKQIAALVAYLQAVAR